MALLSTSFFHAQSPNSDDHDDADDADDADGVGDADALISSFLACSCSGALGSVVLEATGEGPSLFNAAAAATSLVKG